MSRISSFSSSSSNRRHQWRLVHSAASSGDLETLRKASLRDCNKRLPGDETTAVHVASSTGQLAALRLLVERGTKVNQQDAHGNTALHLAVINGQSACALFLVHFGANLWSLNDQFESALDVAVRCGRQELARFLDSTASQQLLTNRKSAEKLRQRAAISAERRIRKKHWNVNPMTSYGSLSSTSCLDTSMWKTRTLPTIGYPSDSMSTTSSFRPYTTLTLSSELAGVRYKPSKPSKQSKDEVKRVSKPTETGKLEEKVRSETGRKRNCQLQQLPSHSAITRTFQTANGPDGQSKRVAEETGAGRAGESSTTRSIMTRSATISDGSSLYCRVLDAGGITGDTSKSRSRRRGPAADTARPDIFVGGPRCIPSPAAANEVTRSPGSPEAGQSRVINSCNATYSEPYDGLSADVRSESSIRKSFIKQSNIVNQSAPAASCVFQQAPVRRRLAAKLADFLTELDLQEYLPLLCRERVDMQSLCLLTDDDLRQIGLPLGPRRTLMNGLQRLSRPSEKSDNCVDTRL